MARALGGMLPIKFFFPSWIVSTSCLFSINAFRIGFLRRKVDRSEQEKVTADFFLVDFGSRYSSMGNEKFFPESPLRHLLDIPVFLPRLYLSLDNLCAVETSLIISRDKGVGRENYELLRRLRRNSPVRPNGARNVSVLPRRSSLFTIFNDFSNPNLERPRFRVTFVSYVCSTIADLSRGNSMDTSRTIFRTRAANAAQIRGT